MVKPCREERGREGRGRERKGGEGKGGEGRGEGKERKGREREGRGGGRGEEGREGKGQSRRKMNEWNCQMVPHTKGSVRAPGGESNEVHSRRESERVRPEIRQQREQGHVGARS